MASVSNTALDSKTLPTNTASDSNIANRRSSNQAPSMDDVNTNPSSPYFIPPSDVVLVSQPLIGPENYLSWSRAVFLSLIGRNLAFLMVQFLHLISLILCTMHGTEQTPQFFHGW